MKQSPFLLLLLATLLFSACLKDKYQTDTLSTEIEWNPSIATALAYGNLKLVNIVKEQEQENYSVEYYTEDNPKDSLIRIVVRQDSIYSYTAFDFLKLPIIETINRKEELGNLKIDDYAGNYSEITMGSFISDQFPSKVNEFNSYHGVLSNIPQTQSEKISKDHLLPPYGAIKWVEFADGEISMTATNNFKTPVKFEMVMFAYNTDGTKYEFGTFDFTTNNSGTESFIAPGNSRTKTILLAGRKASGLLSFRLQNAVIAETNNVIIDLNDQLHFEAISRNVEASSGEAFIPMQDFALDTTTYFTVDSYEGKQIKGMVVKKGTFYYKLESTIGTVIDVEVSFPSITQGTDTLHRRALLDNNRVEGVWNLADYTIDLSKNPSQEYNSLPAKLTYSISSQGKMVKFTATDYVEAQFANNDSLTFSMAYGFFGYDSLVIATDSIESEIDDFLKDYNKGEIYLAEPSVSLILDNSVGITGQLQVSLTGENVSGEKVDLFDGVYDWDIIGPSFDQGAVNYRNELVLDNNTSNLSDFVSLLPSQILYGGKLWTNKGKTDKELNFVGDNSSATLSLHAEFPLKFSMKDVVLQTEVPLSGFGNDIDLQSVELLELYCNVKNQFPLDVSMDLILLDTLAIRPELDTLSITLIKSALSDEKGQVPRDAMTEHTEIFKLVNNGDNSQLDNFLLANCIRVNARLNTENMGDKVISLYTYYGIDFKFGIKTKVLINAKL